MKMWPNNYEALKGGAGFGSNSGTVTSGLYLVGNPVQDLEAAPKQYVDSITESIPANKVSSGTFKIERLPAYSGEVVSVQGTGILSLAPTGVTAGTYTRLSVASSGRVNSGSTLQSSDIPNIPWSKITSNKPTSLEGYGVADAIAKQGGVLSGYLSTSGTASQPLHAVTKGYVDDLSDDTSAIETGAIIESSLQTTPAGYLRCNGALLSKTEYVGLYTVFGDNANLVDYNYSSGAGQPWCQQYQFNTTQSAPLGTWTSAVSLPSPVSNSQLVATKNRAYLIGGNSGSAVTSKNVYTVTINSDGSLGSWSTTTSLPSERADAAAVVVSGYVYLFGGRADSALSSSASTVYRAFIYSDGTLGGWVTHRPLPNKLAGMQAIVTKNRVYLLGGHNGTSYTSDILTATVNLDGSLSDWTLAGNLPVAKAFAHLAVTKNRVYLIGGVNSSGSTVSSVHSVAINLDGTLGEWASETSFPINIYNAQVVVTQGRVYLIGGHNGGGVVSSVYSAPINADGTLGTWASGTSIGGGLQLSQVLVTSQRVFMVGGRNASGPISSSIRADFAGGANDYSVHYTTGYFNTDPDNFKLPDYTSLETADKKYYIKI